MLSKNIVFGVFLFLFILFWFLRRRDKPDIEKHDVDFTRSYPSSNVADLRSNVLAQQLVNKGVKKYNHQNAEDVAVKKAYRLGDLVAYYDPITGNGKKGGVPKGSIGEAYINTTKMKNDETNFALVVNEICGLKKNQRVVVHLRIGDVVDKHLLTKKKNSESLKSRYVPPSVYNRIADHIKKEHPTLKEVVIVAGIHLLTSWETNHKIRLGDSWNYVNAVRKMFQNKGFHVKIEGGGDPDDDMCTMANAPVLVTSEGNFSVLAKIVAEFNGNVVIEAKSFTKTKI
jgi:hypothetical protein